MPTKYNPELRIEDVVHPLALVNVTSDLTRAVSVQEIVDANGAYLDDLGANSERIRFRAAFLGSEDLGNTKEDFPSVEDGLKLFQYFKKNGPTLYFVHPSEGPISGRINNISKTEADEVDAIFLDFSFIEEGIKPLPQIEVDVIAEAERGFRKTIEDETANFGALITDLFGAEGSDLLALDLDPELSILDQVGSFSKGVRDFARSIDEQVGLLEGTLNTITNPANSLIAVIDYGTGLPARVLGSIAAVGERYKEAYNSLLNAPSKFVESMKQGLEDLESVFSGAETESSLKAVNSQNLALGTAAAYEQDQKSRLAMKKIEANENFDTEGNLLQRNEDFEEIENIVQIERSLSSVRESMQAAIDGNRDKAQSGGTDGEVQGLKITSEALLFHVVKTKAEIDRIQTVEVSTGTRPFHLLLNSKGQDYNKAERSLSLQDIKNPTFAEGTVLYYEG